VTSKSAMPEFAEVKASQELVDCGIVVVTYNSARHIDTLLDSIPAASRGLRTRCVVVDNDSQDETITIVRSRTDVKVVNAGGNLGYSAGINIGRSVIGPCSALLILNPDLVIEPGSITELYQSLTTPDIGVAVPMVRNDDGSLSLSLRREPTLFGALGDALFGRRFAKRPGSLSEVIRDEAAYQRPVDVAWATGAALLVSEACDAAVGDWDDVLFFLYAEETDFAARARRCGFRICYVPTARVYHDAGGSGQSAELLALMAVNRIRYYEKYHGRLEAALFRGIVAFYHLLRSMRAEDRITLKIVLHRASWDRLPHSSTRRNGSRVNGT
jgi:N-acetylglucosaminyl-diphospho-decaprenol L-rhamnosyltransferase